MRHIHCPKSIAWRCNSTRFRLLSISQLGAQTVVQSLHKFDHWQMHGRWLWQYHTLNENDDIHLACSSTILENENNFRYWSFRLYRTVYDATLLQKWPITVMRLDMILALATFGRKVPSWTTLTPRTMFPKKFAASSCSSRQLSIRFLLSQLNEQRSLFPEKMFALWLFEKRQLRPWWSDGIGPDLARLAIHDARSNTYEQSRTSITSSARG